MRIGINGYYLTAPYSGIGQYTYNLLQSLSEIDHKNQYYIFTPIKVAIKLPPNFILRVITPLPIFRNTFLNRYLWEEYQLGYTLKKYKIQVFHGMYQSLPRGSEHIGNVVTIHDAIPWKFAFERKEFLYRWYSNIRKGLVTKRAKKIITISEATKLDFAPIYDIKPETIEVTYESVDPVFHAKPSRQTATALHENYHISGDFILYVGGLKRHKNLRMLIKAFAILVQELHYKGKLVIVGAIRSNMAVSSAIYNKVEDLEKYAKMKKVDHQIIFLGNVPEDELAALNHQAQCFVSVSLYEGFGLPALEAMTAGTPSVLSNLGAYPEIADGASLFVYPYGPHRIAEALHEILTNKKFHAELVKKSLHRAKFFDRLAIAQRVLEIYEEVYDDYKINYQP